MTAFYFDMDGTLADLYSIPNWLDKLLREDASPYTSATPLVDMATFVRVCRKRKKQGDTFHIISWGSKNSSPSYLNAVSHAKRTWLAHYCPDVWDGIHVLPYGTPKSAVVASMNIDAVLFDDESRNIQEWIRSGGIAYYPEQISSVLNFSLAA